MWGQSENWWQQPETRTNYIIIYFRWICLCVSVLAQLKLIMTVHECSWIFMEGHGLNGAFFMIFHEKSWKSMRLKCNIFSDGYPWKYMDKIINECFVWEGFWDLHCAPPRGYRTTLCTTDLRSAPPGSIVHHGAQGGPMSVRSGAQPWHFSYHTL